MRSGMVMLSLCILGLLACAAASYDVQNAPVKIPDAFHLALHVYAPNAPNASASFPVIWFATGFGCAVPVQMYSKLVSSIVSQGYIVAGMYHEVPHVPAYIKDGKSMNGIMEWGKENLGAAMRDAKLNAIPDVTGRSAIMGQSAGNHIAGEALSESCSVAKAFIMIDPVDGFDPYRIIKSEDLIKPGEKVNFSIPALLLDNGLDPQRVNSLFPPCAPPEVSNDHFYNAWVGPIWNINATVYGHTDCTDSSSSLICPSNSSTDKNLYRDMLAEAITIFLGGLFGGHPEQLSALETASHWKIDTVLKHDLKGKTYDQIAPGCTNNKLDTFVAV